MPPNLVFLIGFSLIFCVFFIERKWVKDVSPALILVFLWCLVASTKPVGQWFEIWRLPVIGSTDPTEGNIYDKLFYGPLTIFGIFVLVRKKINWGIMIKKNKWLLILFLFMGLSILWSGFPVVSFKRLIKAFGSMVMALIVLTTCNRKTAFTTVLRWVSYIHIPFSIITIKYFRTIGVNWNNFSGEASWIGLATSKNTLGQVAAISAIYFIWDWTKNKGKNTARIIALLYFLMSLYLLKGSDNAVSMTSVSIFLLALFLFLRIRLIKSNPLKVKRFFVTCVLLILGILSILIVHTFVNFSEKSPLGMIINFVGRDMTLTGRTEIWNDVFNIASKSPLIGVGYGGFWIGRIANIPWTEKLTWTLGQAHNGYVDLYLQLGFIGVFIMLILIGSAVRELTVTYKADYDLGILRMILFLTILFVNITETTFLRGDHYLWFLFLLTVISGPEQELKHLSNVTERVQ